MPKTIIQLPVATGINVNDILLVRQAGSDKQVSASGVITPIGVIIPRITGYFTDGSNGGFTSTPISLPDEWKPCDGSLLNDAESPIFNGAGRYLPNLTDDRFLMGDTAMGNTGGANTGHHHDMATSTGQTINLTSGGSHDHETNVYIRGAGANARCTDNVPGGVQLIADANTHVHAVGEFAGKLGEVTAGFDGNAAGSNIPQYLSCEYIMKVK